MNRGIMQPILDHMHRAIILYKQGLMSKIKGLRKIQGGLDRRAHRAGDGIERRLRRQIDAIALEAGNALLIGAGPALVPGDVDVMGDLVAVDGVGAAIAGHAAKQRFDLRGGRLRSGGLAAAAPHGEHEHAPVGAVVDVADGIGPQKLGLGAGGNFLAHRRDELPGADEMLAGGII